MNPADRANAARAVAFTARVLERCLDDMTLPQFRVLSLVASSSERANRIAEQAAVSRPSLTGLLDGLEARGWVRRVDVVGDRRGVLLEVTDSGTKALATAEGAMASALDDLLDTADRDERAAIATGLATLGRVLVARHELRHAGSPRRAAGTRGASDPGGAKAQPRVTATPEPSSGTTAARAGTRR